MTKRRELDGTQVITDAPPNYSGRARDSQNRSNDQLLHGEKNSSAAAAISHPVGPDPTNWISDPPAR